MRDAGLPATDGIHSAFVDRRNRLNQHAERMHKVLAPTELSIYQMQGILLRLPADISSSVRWRAPELSVLTADRAKQGRDLLAEAAGFEALFNRTDPSPWCGLELANAQAAQGTLDAVARVAISDLPSFIDAIDPEISIPDADDDGRGHRVSGGRRAIQQHFVLVSRIGVHGGSESLR